MMKNLAIKMRILERFPCQADFAMAVGQDESKISRVVCGRRTLSRTDAKKWSQVLGCNLRVLESAIDKN